MCNLDLHCDGRFLCSLFVIYQDNTYLSELKNTYFEFVASCDIPDLRPLAILLIRLFWF